MDLVTPNDRCCNKMDLVDWRLGRSSEEDEVEPKPTNRFSVRMNPMVVLAAGVTFCMLLLLPTTISCASPARGLVASALSTRPVQHHARALSSSVLEVFQVYPPVLTVAPDGALEITDGSSNATVEVIPSTAPTCEETLVAFSFANSYGHPFVGQYEPPLCAFDRVTWNLTVTSAGRQFDRLASVSFGDIELFRTSTAEPTANGIQWTYLKDMTNFLSLFKQSQTIIFELGNIVDDTYTGLFNVTLTATFFSADDSIIPADLILSVSSQQDAEGQPSHFTTPPDTASQNLTLPRNMRRAVFTIAATGQAEEEFWWSNVPQSTIDTFPSYGPLYGYSPFREVQLLIDGQLAGVAWPYPIIFTGGVVPGLWRPVVGIDAFDLKEDEIDITPWLPLLCDGHAHNFTLIVSGLNDNGRGKATLSETTLSNWWVGGKVFIWLDKSGHITTGDSFQHITPAPNFQVTTQLLTTANGTNETLIYTVNAQRSLTIASAINLSDGWHATSWSQTLAYSNYGNYTGQGYVSTNQQHTTGYDVSSSGYGRKIDYPLYSYSTYTTNADNFTIYANVNRGKTIQIVGQSVFPTGLESFASTDALHKQYGSFQGASLYTTQNGTATYEANQTAKTSYSVGTTEQDMVFSGIRLGFDLQQQQSPTSPGFEELFHRHVLAVDGSVVQDQETLIDTPVGHYYGSPGSGWAALSGFPGHARLNLGGKLEP